MINKYNRFVVCGDRDYEIAKSVIKILNLNISKSEILKECDLDKVFFGNLSKYLTRGSGNYKYEDLFRELLSQTFKSIDKLPGYLITEVLR